MTHVLENEALAVDDVLLVPQLGKLRSSSEARVQPFIYSAPMDTVTGYKMVRAMVDAGEYAVVCRTLPESEMRQIMKDYAGHPNVFFAIGLCRDALKAFVDQLIALEVTRPVNVAIDVAHGDMEQAHELAAYLSELGVCRFIMSGSICTPQAAVRASTAGCTHLRVGVGPGSVCTTRLMTGCGYPQLSAVYNCKRVLGDNPQGIQIIADGGIRTPGDAMKYLAAGADGIMLGSELGKTLEATGWEHGGYKPVDTSKPVRFPMPDPDPIYVKEYRGQASESFQRDHGKNNDCPEGVSRMIEWQGHTVDQVLRQYRRGVARGISYVGCTSMEELGPKTVEMVRVTNSAVIEGRPQGD
jgi:IMP dehydrogenase